MSVYWKFFKVCLEKSNVNAAYIDDEGSEIPIENECEFKEAVKFAKKFGDNQLHLILKVKDSKKAEHISTGIDKSEIRFMIKPKDKASLFNQVPQCQLDNAAPPIWFTDYMKKFKHKLLEEIKFNIQETVKPILSEIKKLKSNKDAESIGFQTQFSNQEKVYSTLGEDKNISLSENQLFLQDFTKKNMHSNAKKLSVKDSSNISKEQRDLKLMGKTDSLKQQNLDSKYLYDENNKKSGKKSHSKSKLENKNVDLNQKPYTNLKSGHIHMSKSKTVVKPGENFTLALFVSNEGILPWEKPSLKCSAPEGFNIEKKIKLSRTKLIMHNVVTVIGRATKEVGVYKIRFELLDGDFIMTTIDHAIIVKTDDTEPRKTSSVKTGKSKEKTEEAVKEIEKKLNEISLQNSVSTPSNASSLALGEKKSEEKGVVAVGSLDVKTSGKNEEIESYTQSAPSNCLDSSSKVEKNTKIEKGTEVLNEEGNEIVDLINLESNSDSEFSIVCISEGEEEMNSENFVFLSVQPEEKDKIEVKTVKDQATEMNSLPLYEEPIFSTSLKEPLISVNSKSDGKILKKEKEIRKNKKFFSRSRSPLPDDRKSSRTKKLKSFKSTEYQFKAADLTRPALSIYAPYSNTNNNERTFTFTGERQWEQKTPTSSSSSKENKVPTTDSLGRTIYAVSSGGYCLPVEHLMQDDKKKSNGDNNNNNNNNNTSTNTNTNTNTNKSASVNILPDALMSGASNMASLAINTAKSVISNLQSALVKEGTEMGKPACEPKKVKLPSMESLYKLFEMGFTDLQFNRNLLLQHDNDLSKVVEELILLEQSHNRK